MTMEETIIRMAAPTLAGIKTGSLFPYHYKKRETLGKEIARLNRLLIPQGLRLVLLRLTERSALLYLFRPSKLEKDLCDGAACELLRCEGYPCSSCESCLRHLLRRFHCGEEFPHEIGLFLSYPPEDVRGFIENGPRSCKLSGCWKVYGDAEAARKQFERFSKCRRIYRSLLGKGRTVENLTVRT